MATENVATKIPSTEEASREDQAILIFARLMEGGLEDEETCRDLDQLTKLLNDDLEATEKGKSSICKVIDGDCLDTAVCYLDMRQPEVVRGHAILTVSAYLKAAGEEGSKRLSEFFYDRVNRGTYDDYIVAFCVASAIFPIVPDLTRDLFLGEGFLPSLGPLMRRKWKSRKVETACLEMLNAACMNPECREAVQKYCVDWLEEIIDQDPTEAAKNMHTSEPDIEMHPGSISMRKHSEHVQHLAAVILVKIRAVQPPQSTTEIKGERVQNAITSVDDLSKMFAKALLTDSETGRQTSIEGLAYASLQPRVKDTLSRDKAFLAALVQTLNDAPPKSPLTYGALSIIVNLTRYQPVLSEEEKRMAQLKAYANAAGKIQPEPLNDTEHVSGRCMRVFEAGITPVLVSHSKNGSVASLFLIIQIIHALSVTPKLRGQLAQQGAVRLLIAAWAALPPESNGPARRAAAQALARILISTDPALVFGGTQPTPLSAAIRPLASIIQPDPAAETRDLLPTFESLMALTNLASAEDADTRRQLVRACYADAEDALLSSNPLVRRAATELVCNLAQCPEGAAPFLTPPPGPGGEAGDRRRAADRLRILVALADSEDLATRCAAGGALANLSAHEAVVRGLLERQGAGVRALLGLCADESDDLRQRGAFALLNMVSPLAGGDGGGGDDDDDDGGGQGAAERSAGVALAEAAKAAILVENGAAVLTECAKRTRRPEVLNIAADVLRILVAAPEVD